METVNKKRFTWLFILPNVLFALIAYFTDAAPLVVMLNFALVALWAGVCVAYLPPVLQIIVDLRPLDRADVLALGIFFSALSTVVIRTWSIVWRLLGQPRWLLETDIVSYALYTSVIAAVCHLAAPGGVNDRVPQRRWVNIGAWVAMLLFAGLMVTFLVTGETGVP